MLYIFLVFSRYVGTVVRTYIYSLLDCLALGLDIRAVCSVIVSVKRTFVQHATQLS